MKKAFLILGLVAVSAAAGGLTAWTVSADRGGSVAYIEREVERTPALGTQFTRFEMRSAFALRIISGIIIYNFGVQESLRTFLNPIFTERVIGRRHIIPPAVLPPEW